MEKLDNFHSKSDPSPSPMNVPGSGSTSPSSFFEGIPIDEQVIAKFRPLLKKVTKYNFEDFLVKLVNGCPRVPITVLYNLLFNFKYQDPAECASESAELCQRELKLCYLVMETFKNPENPPGPFRSGNNQSRSLSTVNYHELLRNFLAMKILRGILQLEDKPVQGHTSVSRVSVYKVYYIICQQLIARYPIASHSVSLQQCMILGQSKVGKLARLVFPNLISRRLGKRGNSKFHYIGYTWKKSNVDEEILSMSNLDLSEIQHIFKDSRIKPHYKPKGIECNQAPHIETIDKVVDEFVKPRVKFVPPFPIPLHSFVDLSFRYPSSDCSLHIRKCTPKNIPQQSEWAKHLMSRSLGVLKSHNVQFDSLVENFNTGVYCDGNPNGLSNFVIGTLKCFMEDSSPPEVYMHLYLAVLILLFPVILASDAEVAPISKVQLRSSLKACITHIGSEIATPVPVDTIKLGNFTGILKKMITLNEMTSVTVRASSPEEVLNEISKDLKLFGSFQTDPLSTVSPLEDLYVKATILSFNAYNFDIFADSAEANEEDLARATLIIAQGFSSAVVRASEVMQRIPFAVKRHGSGGVTSDVSHQILRLAIEIFHDLCLKNPMILKLPIPIINFLTSRIFDEIQKSCFKDFKKRGPELSKEMFKSWWIFSMMLQDYLSVIAEVYCLSQVLG